MGDPSTSASSSSKIDWRKSMNSSISLGFSAALDIEAAGGGGGVEDFEVEVPSVARSAKKDGRPRRSPLDTGAGW